MRDHTAQPRSRPAVEPLPQPGSGCPAVSRAYAAAAGVARGDVGVCIHGAAGAGKDVLARYVHRASLRARAPLVSLDCAALPRERLEAELFGTARRAGQLALADGGTLLLDEPGALPLETQARLSSALRGAASGVRVIAASRRDLDALARCATFRPDLCSLVASCVIDLPPLRERGVDLRALAEHFAACESARLHLPAAVIAPDALECLAAYDWPGNVRELQIEMACAVLLLDGERAIRPAHLSARARAASPSPRDLRGVLEDTERAEIRRALSIAAGDVARAATLLSVGKSTLYRRMKELRTR